MRRRVNNEYKERSHYNMGGHSIRRISEDVITKNIWTDPVVRVHEEKTDPPAEALALQLVASSTTIPVPSMRRVIFRDGCKCIVMDYIEGTSLASVWPNLSLWSKFKIAWTIRRYIQQLRCIRSPRSFIPGQLGLGMKPKFCRGAVFALRHRGPFPDYASLSTFMNERLAMTIDLYERQFATFHGSRAPFDDSEPLVFTHHDLSMRNFLVGADGRIWLIDFSLSGFYPPYFEYFGMCYTAVESQSPKSWRYLIPLMAGPYFWQREWLKHNRFALAWYE
ncbi:kinase-like domain-containing protein [Sparassis latifolia]